jgi:hypothetical protein
VRHATPAALEHLEPLLERLRLVDGITERKPGNFVRGSRAFLHFHEHGDDTYADVRGATDWDRYKVTSANDQKVLLAAVRRSLAAAKEPK